MTVKEIIKKIVPDFLLDFYHYLLALTGALLYSFPSKKIKVIGVTGTSGKTTAVDLIISILEEGGFKVSCISSIKFKIGNKEWENKLKMTMPGRFKVQKFLKQAVKENCQYAVLEITSEGIKQFRHKFIDFDTAVFTNLSSEHIEAHKSFENYRKAKLELFKKTKNIHIVNLDDKNAEWFLREQSRKKYGYSVNKKQKTENNIYCSLFSINKSGIFFQIRDTRFNLNLLGKFNIYNALSAICVGLSQGISLDICKRALEKAKAIPGRMEVVIDKPFKVIVDYAHTPQSLESVYKTLKNPKSKCQMSNKIQMSNEQMLKMICVLGACGGGRDKWKRPVLGKLAADYCNKVIVTNEDPYDENPMDIINQVAQGAGAGAKKILDRRQAIKEAIKTARPNDIVIITGKGSEPWMCIGGGRKMRWDDRNIVREEIKELKIPLAP